MIFVSSNARAGGPSKASRFIERLVLSPRECHYRQSPQWERHDEAEVRRTGV